jgi:putative glutamine amidotransferase
MSRGSSPLIGITADLSESSGNGAALYPEPTVFLPRRYVSAIEYSCGIPLILPANSFRSTWLYLIGRLDGLLISGGNFDIHPRLYGEKPIEELGIIKARRTKFELEIATAALKRDLPILGICGGAQMINVALGGTLYQDIAAQLPSAGEHQRSASKTSYVHRVLVQDSTQLHKIVQRQTLQVNTRHHQAVKELGRGVIVNAVAEDGVIEGIESTDHEFVVGLQWHPEVLAPRQKLQRRIFSAFTAICRKGRRR